MSAVTGQGRVWTLDAVQRLGMTCDVPTAGQILGISRSLSYRMVQDGTFPVRVLRLCRSVRVSVPELLVYLGVPVTPGPREAAVVPAAPGPGASRMVAR